MLKTKTYLLFILFCISSTSSFSQYFLYTASDAKNIFISFNRHSIEASAGQTIFNVIKLVNKSNSQQSYTLSITIPEGWNVIGSNRFEVSIGPQDSTLIPVRVAINSRVRGDIGYSIIAAIADSKGNIIKTEYSFVKILRVTDTRIKLQTRRAYIDQQTRSSQLNILVENKGNREEPVNIKVAGTEDIEIDNTRLSTLIKDFTVSPYKDTVVSFTLHFNSDLTSTKNQYRIDVSGKTIDTTFNSTAWLLDVKNQYENIIPSNQKVLVVELISRGLFSKQGKPKYGALVEGNILFSKNREVFFYYNNYDLSNPDFLYDRSRYWVGYRQKNFSVKFGDIYSTMESSTTGKGGQIDFTAGRFNVSTMATYNLKNSATLVGSKVIYNIYKSISIITGYTRTENNYNLKTSQLGLLGTSFNLFKFHRFSLLGLYNQNTLIQPDTNISAYGGELTYNYSQSKFQTSFRTKFGSKNLNTGYNGKFELYYYSTYFFDNNSTLSLNISNYRNQPSYFNLSSKPDPFSNSFKSQLNYGFNFRPKIHLFFGSGIEYQETDLFPALKTGIESFGSRSGLLFAGTKLRGSKFGDAINIQYTVQFIDVNKAPKTIWSNPKIYPERPIVYANNLSLSFRRINWGIQAFFSSGPRSINDQFTWYYSNRDSRYIRLIPNFSAYIFQKNIFLDLSLSYSNDLISKNTYTNINSQIIWYLPKSWQLRLLNVYSLQSRTRTGGDVERYQNTYFEFGIRKEFGLPQPRQKFHDLNLIFFKDYNGNAIKEDNEPGIKNVLLNIQRVDQNIVNYQNFFSIELLSDQFGKVSLEQIPDGSYELNYNTIGNDAGSFSKASDLFKIEHKKNITLYIPFVEKNKVFGKIILSRSRLSGLGKLDVSNVRITATDSKGRTYNSLTDKNGEFVIFAPVTDQYVVNVNNIFYENFDLRQNNFKVQFNGYKQFEVNFVFDEKIRRINFNPSSQDAQLTSILQVRKTNLKGSVKDASSLLPIRARVNLINTKTNTVLTSIYANAQTGDYNISFMADDNYLLEILADGYWYHSENLNLNQVTTFLNVTKDVMLKPITIGSKVELNITFDINKSDLAAESVAELNRLLKLLKDNENIKIEIQGHSDDLEALSNPQISEDRAKKVARYLIENGFSNLQIRGFGNTVPVASNNTEEGRSANRRVEIEVVSK
jgi:outer membrane protein OmpA-like peptidoglycan-associated protein